MIDRKPVKEREPLNGKYFTLSEQRAYLDGLETGRNEQRKVFAENCKRCPKKQLEKEVEELKRQIEKMK